MIGKVAAIPRFADPGELTTAARHAVAGVAAEIEADYPALAGLLRLPPAGGPPLLASAFLFFFRREVETNAELARGLTFDSLRRLTFDQEQGVGFLQQALDGLGGQADALFAAMQEGFDRLAGDIKKVLHILEERRVHTAPTSPLAISVTDAAELELLRRVRNELRGRPAGSVPAVFWEAVGDGMAAAGQSADAEDSHRRAADTAQATGNRTAEAANRFKAYKDACEKRDWPTALTALRAAVTLDPAEYRLIDPRYEILDILGAGGFGVVFLCHDLYDVDDRGNPAQYAVKALYTADLDRGVQTVFAEAKLLQQVAHKNIIRVHLWNFADQRDRANPRRPYLVLEYFPGRTLEAVLADAHRLGSTDFSGPLPPCGGGLGWGVKSGSGQEVVDGEASAQPPTLTLPRKGEGNKSETPITVDDVLAIGRQVAEAVHAAHAKGVYHRDLKPANVLVEHGENNSWRVKVIDFGLAVKASTAVQASSARAAGVSTLREASHAGTWDYAAPEQKGKLVGVSVGPYSDVYGFGKTIQMALFETTEPVSPHWDALDDPRRDAIRKLVEGCVVSQVTGRFIRTTSFAPVIAALDALLAKAPPATGPHGGEVIDLISIQVPAVAAQPVVKPPLLLNKPQANPKVGDTFISCLKDTEMKFAWIPPGIFLMGWNGQGDFPQHQLTTSKGVILLDPRNDLTDNPQHRVTISKGFWMGSTPVTQAQWQVVMGNNPSNFRGDDRPVEMVSWRDCQEFCQKMKQLTGKPIRLPTEAEWEYACRAGSTGEYWNGNGEESLEKIDWFKGYSGCETKPVGKIRLTRGGFTTFTGTSASGARTCTAA